MTLKLRYRERRNSQKMQIRRNEFSGLTTKALGGRQVRPRRLAGPVMTSAAQSCCDQPQCPSSVGGQIRGALKPGVWNLVTLIATTTPDSPGLARRVQTVTEP